jgi:hypothetical protein
MRYGPQTLLLVPSYTYGLATDGRFRQAGARIPEQPLML